eukprot:SAG11_NODE_24472_length_372_cov_96.736264_1_plen_74_part_00
MPQHNCPKCNNNYETKYETIKISKVKKDTTATEQFLSGICGDKCWFECSENEIVLFKFIKPKYSKSATQVHLV